MYSPGGGFQTVIQDSGPASGGATGLGLSEFLQVNKSPTASSGSGPLGTHDCRYDAPVNSGAYHFLCFDANAQGGGLLAYGNAGTAPQLPFQFYINGSYLALPGSGSCLGCGTIVGQNANNVAITGGSITNTMIAGSTTASGTAAVPVTIASIAQEMQSVKNWGALGNSNGTTGNGHDDTSAIETALANASQGAVFFPCGTYRITSTITLTGPAYHLSGQGACSQIFLDMGSGGAALSFTKSAFCTACVVVSGLDFIAPTTPASSVAINLQNETQSTIEDNQFSGYQTAIFLTTAFAPNVRHNLASGLTGTFLNTAGDQSLNGARIKDNAIFSSGAGTSSYAMQLNCSGAFSLSVTGNDMEGNYGGVLFGGCNSVDFSDNYIENSTTSNFQFVAGTTNIGYTIRNNWFGSSASSVVGPVQQVQFGANTLFELTISWASTALGVIVEPTNNVTSTAELGPPPSPTLSGCGGGSPVIVGTRLSGIVTEGTSATGCVVTYELPFTSNAPVVVSPISTVAGLAISSITSTGFTVSNTSGTGGEFSYQVMVYR